MSFAVTAVTANITFSDWERDIIIMYLQFITEWQ
jgi:hypothetical protein